MIHEGTHRCRAVRVALPPCVNEQVIVRQVAVHHVRRRSLLGSLIQIAMSAGLGSGARANGGAHFLFLEAS